MLSDDVFRDRLEQTLLEVETWAAGIRDCADVGIAASDRYWRMAVVPSENLACAFELIMHANQTFGLRLGAETYEDRPIEQMELFPALVRAIEAGHVDRIEMYNAMTAALTGVATRVELEPGWDWVGHRRISPAGPGEEWRTRRFLPYRR
ncbi:MAG TPA: hypothetical protein VNZ50_12180 [Hyphomicrobiaceae bacterium]|uniref:hypothetical protein n=1 Tax=Hyphomicrobium sp. TaxID=82 RepID=UPI002CC91DB3|nr:hypothetical protein [Hyphomicrobium sp.]HET6388672.1 hypothetical protein [Hyphomicrobium sp.]HWV82182.1 hypothetical protein [Hyphomicrobiaceae bacterium]